MLCNLGDFSELNENLNLLVCKSACPASRKFSNEQWIKEQWDDECIAQLIEILKGRKVEKGNIYDYYLNIFKYIWWCKNHVEKEREICFLKQSSLSEK